MSDDLDAGSFSHWLAGASAALRGADDADVPCGTCTACCSSSQFVHIRPDEHDTLAHIPDQLLFPAPGLPLGHVLMGYDEHGRCPMLIDERCTVYAHRPRTCRTYDCRVFAATEVAVDDASKAAIAERVRRWRFSFPADSDLADRAGAVAAAEFLRRHRDELAERIRPHTSTQLAVLATEVASLFRPGGPVPTCDDVERHLLDDGGSPTVRT